MSRAASVITCPLCAWRAKCVGDTMAEVIEVLEKALTEHTQERHTEKEQS